MLKMKTRQGLNLSLAIKIRRESTLYANRRISWGF